MAIQRTFIHFHRLFCLSALLFLARFGNAQENLIKNPSFENLNCSPQTHYDFQCVEDWWNVNNTSIDIWNRFASNGNNFFENPDGPQDTEWGDNYIGILLTMKWFSMSPPNYEPTFQVPDGYGYNNYQIIEVAGGKLEKSLENRIYYYEFYVNVPDYTYIQDDPDQSYLISNSLDMYILDDDTLNLQNPSQYNAYGKHVLKNETIFKDTVNWTKISGCFLANGGEKYFAVGSIRDTNQIATEQYISWGNDVSILSYLLMDNFKLFECDTCCLGEFPYEDHVSVSSNPGSVQNPTTFSVLLNPNTTGTLALYDSAGRLVAKEEFSQLLTTYTLPALAKGVYQYALTTSNRVEDVGKVLVVE
ncbi:MAG: hypothetical protein RLZ33_1714 [Bacteroidota bacterium]